MKISRLHIFIFCVLVFCTPSAFGQTEQEIEKKYGKAIKVYSVDDTIWMSARYTSNGQVCEMTLYPKRVSDGTVYLGYSQLPPWELKRTIDRIIPPSERGQEGLFSGLTLGMGASISTGYNFENVMIAFRGSIHIKKDSNQAKEVADNENNKMNAKEAEKQNPNGFPDSVLHNVEIVSITWKNRTCSDN